MRIIAGTARGRKLIAPDGLDTRPTLDRVRENIFNIIRDEVRDSRVLDLFAGSGAMAYEALSRGAASAVLVDHNREAVRCIKANGEKLGFMDRARVIQADWRAAMTTLRKESFDLVLLDPPYAMDDLSPVMAALKPCLTDHALIVLEHRAGHMPVIGDDFMVADERHYGVAGITLLRMSGANGEDRA